VYTNTCIYICIEFTVYICKIWKHHWSQYIEDNTGHSQTFVAVWEIDQSMRTKNHGKKFHCSWEL